jgi:Flp pilus assembly protein TadG
MKIVLRLLHEEKGSVIIVMVIFLTVLIGMAAMVTDTGAMYLTRSRLQNAVDAAVLAGIQDLPGNPSQAVETASAYAANNSPLHAEIDIPQILETNHAIYVSAHKTVNFGFGRVMGLDSKLIEAEAQARLEPITGVSGALPLAVMKGVWTLGDTVTLKGGAQEAIDGGWRGAISLGGNGTSVYEENLKKGYAGILRLEDLVNVENGNMSGPTQTGTGYRLAACPHTPKCTITQYNLACPRIGVVPVVEQILLTDKKGDQTVSKKQVRITGFALFLFSDVFGNGSDSRITGRFIQGIVQGESDPNAPDYGLYKAKLVQ